MVTDVELELQHHAFADLLEFALKVGFPDGQGSPVLVNRGHTVFGGRQLITDTVSDRLHFAGSTPREGSLDIGRGIEIVLGCCRKHRGKGPCGRNAEGDGVADIKCKRQLHHLPDILDLALKIRFPDGQCRFTVNRRRQIIIADGFQDIAVTVYDGRYSSGSAPRQGGLDIDRLVEIVLACRRRDRWIGAGCRDREQDSTGIEFDEQHHIIADICELLLQITVQDE